MKQKAKDLEQCSEQLVQFGTTLRPLKISKKKEKMFFSALFNIILTNSETMQNNLGELPKVEDQFNRKITDKVLLR